MASTARQYHQQDAEAGKPLNSNLPPLARRCNKLATFWRTSASGAGRHPTPLDFGFDRYIAEKEYNKLAQEQGLPPCPNTNRGLAKLIQRSRPRIVTGVEADRTIEQLQICQRRSPSSSVGISEPHLPNVVPNLCVDVPARSIPPWQPSRPHARQALYPASTS